MCLEIKQIKMSLFPLATWAVGIVTGVCIADSAIETNLEYKNKYLDLKYKVEHMERMDKIDDVRIIDGKPYIYNKDHSINKIYKYCKQ